MTLNADAAGWMGRRRNGKNETDPNTKLRMPPPPAGVAPGSAPRFLNQGQALGRRSRPRWFPSVPWWGKASADHRKVFVPKRSPGAGERNHFVHQRKSFAGKRKGFVAWPKVSPAQQNHFGSKRIVSAGQQNLAADQPNASVAQPNLPAAQLEHVVAPQNVGARL